jgi:hypothetical protein
MDEPDCAFKSGGKNRAIESRLLVLFHPGKFPPGFLCPETALAAAFLPDVIGSITASPAHDVRLLATRSL